MEAKKKFKLRTAEEAKEALVTKMHEVGVAPDAASAILEAAMEENRQAWFAGKEFGWKKAWHWQKKKEEAVA